MKNSLFCFAMLNLSLVGCVEVYPHDYRIVTVPWSGGGAGVQKIDLTDTLASDLEAIGFERNPDFNIKDQRYASFSFGLHRFMPKERIDVSVGISLDQVAIRDYRHSNETDFARKVRTIIEANITNTTGVTVRFVRVR